MTTKRNGQQSEKGQHGVVLFGRGKDGKLRAASFSAAHARLAIKAAKALKFEVLPIQGETLPALADNLPAGRIHASGLGVVPAVRPRLYEQIAALTSHGSSSSEQDSSPSSASLSAARNQPRLPTDWQSIDTGDLVIAQEDDKADGWWPAIIEERTGDRFILRWHGYPRQRKFIRQRVNLALLNPDPDLQTDADPAASPTHESSRYPSSWAEITVGHLVLAQEDGPLGAWWPAIVAHSEAGQATLQWHDHERLPAVIRDRVKLALLHPQPD